MAKYREHWSKYLVFLIILLMLGMNRNKSSIVTDKTETGWLVQHAGEEEDKVYTNHYVLDKGSYTFCLQYYVTNEGSWIGVYYDGVEYTRVPLGTEETTATLTFELDDIVSDVEISVTYSGVGYIEIDETSLQIEGGTWNKDEQIRTCFALCFILSIIIIDLLYRHNKLTHVQVEDIFLIVTISALVSCVLFSDNRVGNGDDLKYHLMRIEGIAAGLRQGQFPVFVYPNMVNGNGYLNVMYPSLFLYMPAILRNLGASYVFAYKSMLVCINLCTCISMYVAVKSIVKDRYTIFFTVIMYAFFRYRLNNMYVRGALGETLAMVFLPLILAGLYHVVCGDRKKWKLLAIGTCGVIQSHILSVVLYAIICGVIVLIFIGNVVKEKRYVEILKTVLVVLALNVWFIIPFVFYYFNGNLALDRLSVFYYWKEALNPSYLLGLFWFTKTEQGYGRDYSLRLPIVLLILFDLWCYFSRGKNKKGDFWNVLFSISILMIFMSTNLFPYDLMRRNQIADSFFKFVQFPWRFVGIAVGMGIFVAAFYLNEIVDKRNLKVTVMIALSIIMAYDISTWNLQWNESLSGYFEQSEDQNEDSPTKEKVCADIITYAQEYMVSGSGEILSSYEINGEDVNITEYCKSGLNIDFKYTSNTKAIVGLPLMNYKIYDVRDEAGNKISYETGEYGNLSIELEGDGKEHTIYVRYSEPFVFRVGEVISLLTLLCIGIYILKNTGFCTKIYRILCRS